MATDNSTPAAGSEEQDAIKEAATVDSMMSVLWERTADSLTDKELEWFAFSNEYARMHARNLGKIIEGLGCLINSDTQAGSFQDRRDVSTLLFSIAHQVDTITGMIEISDNAQHRLLRPDWYQGLREHRAKYADA